MKAAEEYWDEHMKNTACPFRGCSDLRQSDIRELIAAIAADARADALAEAKAVTDPDEERAKAEWKRFEDSWHAIGLTCSPPSEDAYVYKAFAHYVKTLPPRPMRSPGQRFFEAVRKLGIGSFTDTYKRLLEEWPNKAESFESAAEELGIQSKE